MSQKYVIGIDEAGYGPNLGPLVIAASLWRVPETLSEKQLSERLETVFKALKWSDGCQHVPLGDSKKLHSQRNGLDSLEIGLLACMACSQARLPESLQQLLSISGVDALDREASSCPWYYALEGFAVPESTKLQPEIDRLAHLAAQHLASNSLQLLALQAEVVTEPTFNSQLTSFGSKGMLLSHATINLAARVLRAAERDSATTEAGSASSKIELFCDRQGGRKDYLPLLMHHFPNSWFAATSVSPQRSSYSTLQPPHRCFHFSVGGDRFAPTGLASMLAKYLRERLMQSLNGFWAKKIPGLRPTAGYPVDAQRFRTEIEATAADLQLDAQRWWRNK